MLFNAFLVVWLRQQQDCVQQQDWCRSILTAISQRLQLTETGSTCKVDIVRIQSFGIWFNPQYIQKLWSKELQRKALMVALNTVVAVGLHFMRVMMRDCHVNKRSPCARGKDLRLQSCRYLTDCDRTSLIVLVALNIWTGSWLCSPSCGEREWWATSIYCLGAWSSRSGKNDSHQESDKALHQAEHWWSEGTRHPHLWEAPPPHLHWMSPGIIQFNSIQLNFCLWNSEL